MNLSDIIEALTGEQLDRLQERLDQRVSEREEEEAEQERLQEELAEEEEWLRNHCSHCKKEMLNRKERRNKICRYCGKEREFY